MIVASRSLHFYSPDSSEKIRVEIIVSLPKPSEDMEELIECEIKLIGPLSRTEKVYGLDSLQALSLALYSAVNYLRLLESSGKLCFINGEEYLVDDDFSFMRQISDYQ
jgi:hypothetical protein